jgi:hypothetical protein
MLFISRLRVFAARFFASFLAMSMAEVKWTRLPVSATRTYTIPGDY